MQYQSPHLNPSKEANKCVSQHIKPSLKVKRGKKVSELSASTQKCWILIECSVKNDLWQRSGTFLANFWKISMDTLAQEFGDFYEVS